MKKQTKKIIPEILTKEELKIILAGGSPWTNTKAPKRPLNKLPVINDNATRKELDRMFKELMVDEQPIDLCKNVFNYIICNEPNEKIFYKQCKALEKYVPNLKKGKLLEDVDCSKIQLYDHEKGVIKVSNDFYRGLIEVKSDFDLMPYFQ